MTDRTNAKPKRSVDAKAAAGRPEAADRGEVMRLKAELQAAEARIRELEETQAAVLNRIDWVIDSLHNLPG